ncbi:hypothetical protein [Streptomyces sp. NPDC059786]|uniref:hypothetical protein n=1 Tax=Streptomyces sp. NPDC059786 TaxID=3346946 RepID=UPI003666584A
MPASAHPMANPGYGKRSAPDQSPSRTGDFNHLPPRERYVAAFIDRLPDGAAMDAKTLAKALPLYGQQAVRSALNELSRAGHLRRVRCRAQGAATGEGTGEGVTRWVFRTLWSRTARDSEWWTRVFSGDVPSPQAAAGVVTPTERPRPSEGYEALARLGRAEPRLALSAADCAALEGLAADWLARGVTADRMTQSLTAGLPDQVHSPRAFLRRRLQDKMPPEPSITEARPPLTMPECTDCGVPGSPEALPDGLCRACRGGTTPEEPWALPATAVRARAAQVRGAIRTPLRV